MNTYLCEKPLIGCAELLVSFLLLAPPRKAEDLISHLQPGYTWPCFDNGSGCSVSKHLGMLDEQAAVVLMEIEWGGGSPFHANTDFVALWLDGGHSHDLERLLKANGDHGCMRCHRGRLRFQNGGLRICQSGQEDEQYKLRTHVW